MLESRFHPTFFCVFVFLCLGIIFIPTADGLCSHPPHEANEKIAFSSSSINNTYYEDTVATYYCENSTVENGFKNATCRANQIWTFSEPSSHISCSQVQTNRCQRTSKIGISPAQNSLIFSETCFSLHLGIKDTTLDDFESECDIGPFRQGLSPYAESGLFPKELEKMCASFQLPNESQRATRKILLAVKPQSSDLSWWKRFKTWITNSQNPPKCYYLKCQLNSNNAKVDTDDCNADQNYWICKHNISSCGIPSRPLHSTIVSYGIHIGAIVSYQCQEGYFSDISNRTCQKDGYWSQPPPSCRPVDCGKPVVNENVTYELVTKNQTTYGSWLMHKCNLPSQTINGSVDRICLANGSWDGESPVCQSLPFQLTENDGNSNSLINLPGLNPREADLLKLCIGIIVGVTLLLIASMWLVLIVLLLHDKRKRKLNRKLQSKTEM